jgi:hydroxylamine dehydrogenase
VSEAAACSGPASPHREVPLRTTAARSIISATTQGSVSEEEGEMRYVFWVMLAVMSLASTVSAKSQPRKAPQKSGPELSADSRACYQCHSAKTPVIAQQWAESKHARIGVGCFECHHADPAEPDAFQHHGQTIATIVTPKDCGTCHVQETEEFTQSHHAQAAQFIGSLDNVLGELAEGPLAAANGCWQCHGSTVRLLTGPDGNPIRDENGKPKIDPLTWPNTGIGRVNLDGSRGSCSACHARHNFSRAVGRFPDTCGKCHMGPDHPQIEIFNESKHGIAFHAHQSEMHLDSESWILGKDYSAAPTCATCHMSATPTQPVTHDVGARISWTLRPVISKKLENWEPRRARMQQVCGNCHGPDFVNAFYVQFDKTVDLYNEKFAKPAQQIMDTLRAKKKITPDPFDDKIEWTFYLLWHHEGRRARMGVSMQGPDYTQWHGFFEVAHRFYFELIPQARELAGDDPEIQKVISDILDQPEHAWLKGLSPAERQKILEFYKQRYGQ